MQGGLAHEIFYVPQRPYVMLGTAAGPAHLPPAVLWCARQALARLPAA